MSWYGSSSTSEMAASTAAEMSEAVDDKSKDQQTSCEVVMEIFSSFQQAFNTEQDVREVGAKNYHACSITYKATCSAPDIDSMHACA